MGGYGSGRRYGRTKVEDCRSIDANNFARWGLFKKGKSFDALRWTRGEHTIASCWVFPKIDNIDDSITFSYKYDDKSHLVKINLSWYSPGFGGRRYLFICPHCGRRMRTLHLNQGEIACRLCHNLTYESCNEAHRFDILCKHIAENLKKDRVQTSWQEVKRHISAIKHEPKRPRGRPRKNASITADDLIRIIMDVVDSCSPGLTRVVS